LLTTRIAQKDGRKHRKHDEGHPNATQRAFALLCRNFGVEQFVIHGDLAHLGFQPGDFIITVVAPTFFQGRSGPSKSTIAPIGQLGDGDPNATHRRFTVALAFDFEMPRNSQI
jgi:hypothetical protein